MRILIVEDEPTLGKQLKNTLEANGYAVDLSVDGEDGHFMGSTEEYDAVILDLGLPEIDGLTVLGMWRKEGRKFPERVGPLFVGFGGHVNQRRLIGAVQHE